MAKGIAPPLAPLGVLRDATDTGCIGTRSAKLLTGHGPSRRPRRL